MRNRGQHIISFLFTAIILFPLLAIAFLQLAQVYIKSNREERFKAEKLVHVVLPVNEVVWEEEGKELWVGSRMFDVTSFSIMHDSYHLTGVYDDNETGVADSLLHSLGLDKDGDMLHLLLLLQCFTVCILLFYFMQNHQWHAGHFMQCFLFLPHPSYLVLSPPPRG